MRRMQEKLYYGNLNPNGRSFIRDNDYSKAIRTISEKGSETSSAPSMMLSPCIGVSWID